MQLSSNFTLAEMLESQTARRHGFDEQFRPSKSAVNNLKLVADNILQPLRNHTGQPIRISSGYRCRRVNTQVGGAANSQHVTGNAVDIISASPNVSNATLFELIQRLKLPYDQLIWEFGTRINPAWVHVSFSNRHRRQIIYIPANLRP